jgi:hypothetical protein
MSNLKQLVASERQRIDWGYPVGTRQTDVAGDSGFVYQCAHWNNPCRFCLSCHNGAIGSAKQRWCERYYTVHLGRLAPARHNPSLQHYVKWECSGKVLQPNHSFQKLRCARGEMQCGLQL